MTRGERKLTELADGLGLNHCDDAVSPTEVLRVRGLFVLIVPVDGRGCATYDLGRTVLDAADKLREFAEKWA